MNIRRFSSNEILWFSVAAICVSVLLRWPITSHEQGIDSFMIHSLVNSTIHDGSAAWLVSPLNFFGAYALSYPAGYPMILAEISQMTGFSVESVILLGSFACGALATITTFMLILEIRRNPFFAFLISVAYATAPIFLTFTSWTATTRGIFVSLIPLTIWLLIKSERLRGIEMERGTRRKLLIFLMSDLVLMMALHRLAFMLAIFFFAYFIWRSIDSRWLKQIALRFGARKGRAIRTAIIGSFASILGGSVVYLSISSGAFNFGSFSEGIFQGDSNIIIIVNMISSIGVTIGYPLAFAFPFALLFILRDRKWDFPLLFFTIAFLLLLTFAGGRIYDRVIYPIILLPLIVIPIVGKGWPRSRRKYRKFIVIAVAITLPLNFIIVVEHYNKLSENKVINDGISISEESYSTGLFAYYYLDGEHFIGNNWIMSIRFQSVSGCFELPVITSPSSEGTNLLISHSKTPTDLNYQINSLWEIIRSQGIFFNTDSDLEMQIDWARLFYSTPDLRSGDTLLKQYNVTFMLEDARIPGKITGYGSAILYPIGAESSFMTSVHSSMYKIFDDGREYIWLIAT